MVKVVIDALGGIYTSYAVRLNPLKRCRLGQSKYYQLNDTILNCQQVTFDITLYRYPHCLICTEHINFGFVLLPLTTYVLVIVCTVLKMIFYTCVCASFKIPFNYQHIISFLPKYHFLSDHAEKNITYHTFPLTAIIQMISANLLLIVTLRITCTIHGLLLLFLLFNCTRNIQYGLQKHLKIMNTVS